MTKPEWDGPTIPTRSCPVHYQKFIAYALIGYIDVIKRSGVGDYAFNYVIGNRFIERDLERSNVENSILELFDRLDEIESLHRMAKPEDFEKEVSALLSPVIAFLRENLIYEDDPKPPIKRLLEVTR
jgi:hypothetical protein